MVVDITTLTAASIAGTVVVGFFFGVGFSVATWLAGIVFARKSV